MVTNARELALAAGAISVPSRLGNPSGRSGRRANEPLRLMCRFLLSLDRRCARAFSFNQPCGPSAERRERDLAPYLCRWDLKGYGGIKRVII